MAFNTLVVDDSAGMRMVIRKILVISGFDLGDLYEAENGRRALEILSERWVDLVLTDINMPEMDGLTLLRKMREHEIHRHTPVIIITTEASQASIDEANSLGVRGYITKPFVPEQVKQTLEEIMRGDAL